MEAFVAAGICRLLGYVTNLLKEKVEFIMNAKKDFEEFQRKLKRLQEALKDLDRKPFFSDQRDRDREGELKDVLYDAQDIIEECQTKIKVQKLCPSFAENVSFRDWLSKKIKKVNKRLSEIDLRMLKTTPKEGGEGPVSGEHDNPRETTQHIGAHAPIGKEDDKEKVKNLLLRGSMESVAQEEHGVSIISIVGQGGIGKTTLAKMVFGEVEEQFGKRRWWVCVSERPNRKDLLLKILKEVLKGSERDVGVVTSLLLKILKEVLKGSERDVGAIPSLSLSDLCTRLKANLSKERFLLVLDDVWELDWWHGDVEGVLMKGAMGSKILITTRNENVSKGMNASYMHKVPKLTFDESWILFLKMASKEESELVSHNLKDIATNIVRKCGGLPLVVQTVGSLMRTKEKDEWETVEKSKIWEWKMAASWSSCEYGGILPGLILSYDDLPSYLKDCFVYCSIFPKDYEIKREKLIMQWVAHGLIEENKDIDVEVTANQYINDLIRRCLIEETEKGDLKLHDILHDLASYIGGKEYNQDLLTEHTRHLSLLSAVDVEAMPSASPEENKLRTLLIDGGRFSVASKEHLTNFKWLRVLSLRNCRMNELPKSIGCLSLLKYLDLSHSSVRKLPTSIGRLCNLQTMNLTDSEMKELPKEMGELCNLRYLGLEGTRHLEFIAEGLGKLSNLRTLKGRIRICDDRENTRGCNMSELRGLNKLRGELSIEGLGGSRKAKGGGRKAIHGAEKAPQLLKEKSGLISLKLDFRMQRGENVASASEQSDMLEALEPPRGLEELKISGYQGQMPAWFLQTNYAMLQTLELEECPFWVKVITISSLERLSVNGCPTLYEIPSMPLLKFLDIRFCRGFNTIGHMPALEYLKVEKCDSLKLVADMPTVKSLIVRNSYGLKTLANIPALELLEVVECDGLEQVADGMPALKVLRLFRLNTLKRLPTCLPSLEELVVCNSPNWESALISPLPSEVSTILPSLKRLSLGDRYSYPEWGRVPEWVWGLSQLEDLDLTYFSEEISLGGHWQCLQKLRRLTLDSFGSLKSLVDINIIPQQNNAVATTPATDANEQIACLSRLEKLKIQDCPKLDLPQELRNRLGERLQVRD